jgi:hypothetical protein
MKRIFTFFYFISVSSVLMFSQVTLTKASHGFEAGMIHETVSVGYCAPGNAGIGQVWDFSAVNPAEKTQATYSGLEDNFDAGNIKAVRDDGISFFFMNNENVNEYWGYSIGNQTFKLTQPVIKTKYPQEYGTHFDGVFSGVVKNGDSEKPIEGKYSTFVDAAGTLILPNDISLQAIRVKTTVETYNNLQVKYLWYAQSERLPVFVTFEDYAINTDGTMKLTFSDSHLNLGVKRTPTGIDNLGKIDYKILQNPFKEEISMTYYLPNTEDVTIDLLNASGVKIANLVSGKKSGSQVFTQNVASYTPTAGVYLLKLKFGDKVYTEKLVKTY